MPFSIGLRFVTTVNPSIMSPFCQAMARLNELHSKHDACVAKVADQKAARKRAKDDVRQVRAAKDGLVTKVDALRTTLFQSVQRDAAKLLQGKPAVPRNVVDMLDVCVDALCDVTLSSCLHYA